MECRIDGSTRSCCTFVSAVRPLRGLYISSCAVKRVFFSPSSFSSDVDVGSPEHAIEVIEY